MVPIRGHNISFYGKFTEIIFKLFSNIHLIHRHKKVLNIGGGGGGVRFRVLVGGGGAKECKIL